MAAFVFTLHTIAQIIIAKCIISFRTFLQFLAAVINF